MPSAIATARLRKELIKLQKEPPPDVIGEPDEANILKWYYGIRGPEATPFEGGTYVGKLIFPSEYPMKPPSIYMLTPSGRFQINTKLCMSMSDFHPESWNPMWSVASIIQGIQSFMASDELTTGGLRSPESERKKLAGLSMQYNQKMFPNLFGGDIEAAFAAADKARIEAEASSKLNTGTTTTTNRRSRAGRASRRSAAQKESSKEEEEEEEQAETEENNEESKAELTPEEIEKRRKRNAKKAGKAKGQKSSCCCGIFRTTTSFRGCSGREGGMKNSNAFKLFKIV